ncbi:MAG: arylesterase [Rhizobiales bacterium]|nr:arylesterase [Hyphomicrobiales bacterium]
MRYGLSARICKLAAILALLLAIVATAPAHADSSIRIVALGDSLSAGYMLPPGKGFPEQLQKALREKGIEDVEIENAGVSGDTSSGGLARLDWAVGENTDGVILELGANDALRGIDPAITRKNLETIITRLQARGIVVLLAGMYAPPNLGREYGDAFNSLYPELAERYQLVFYPFFLDGVAADPDLNLGDGMHPNEAGVLVMIDHIMPKIDKLISDIRARKQP